MGSVKGYGDHFPAWSGQEAVSGVRATGRGGCQEGWLAALGCPVGFTAGQPGQLQARPYSRGVVLALELQATRFPWV